MSSLFRYEANWLAKPRFKVEMVTKHAVSWRRRLFDICLTFSSRVCYTRSLCLGRGLPILPTRATTNGGVKRFRTFVFS